jgi:uncharacterized protein YbcI
MTYTTDGRGQITEAISRDVTLLHSRLYGKEPTSAKTVWRDNLIVVLMEGVLTRGEQVLCDADSFETVRRHREEFQDEAEPLLRGIVEGLAGRPVRGFLSQVSAQDMATEVFVL